MSSLNQMDLSGILLVAKVGRELTQMQISNMNSQMRLNNLIEELRSCRDEYMDTTVSALQGKLNVVEQDFTATKDLLQILTENILHTQLIRRSIETGIKSRRSYEQRIACMNTTTHTFKSLVTNQLLSKTLTDEILLTTSEQDRRQMLVGNDVKFATGFNIASFEQTFETIFFPTIFQRGSLR